MGRGEEDIFTRHPLSVHEFEVDRAATVPDEDGVKELLRPRVVGTQARRELEAEPRAPILQLESSGGRGQTEGKQDDHTTPEAPHELGEGLAPGD